MPVPPTFPQGPKLPAMKGRRADTAGLKHHRLTWVKITGTTHGTPGTTTTHAHGLGRTPRFCWIKPLATVENTPSIAAAFDGTNITVRSLGASQALEAWVF